MNEDKKELKEDLDRTVKDLLKIKNSLLTVLTQMDKAESFLNKKKK